MQQRRVSMLSKLAGNSDAVCNSLIMWAVFSLAAGEDITDLLRMAQVTKAEGTAKSNAPELWKTATPRQSETVHNEPLKRWNLLPQIRHAFHEGETPV
jgi:hypothetical protein